MEYDALGRRIKKICNEKTNRYLWDGNVLLNEWDYQKEEEHETSVNDLGEVFLSQKEKVNNLVTWVYDTNNYNPSAKILGEEVYSIINDYLGTPVQAYNSNGKLIWERELDIYGKTRKIEGDQNLIPFLYQGQYYDHDIELAYNRFRYYNPETGTYISQDPIGLAGNNPTFYAYVHDSNSWVDPFGLMANFPTNITFAGSSDLYPVTGNQKNIVEIVMTGDRDADFTRAYKEAGISKQAMKGQGYTWHHVHDFDPTTGKTTMELVKTSAHEATLPHKGSASQFAEHFGVEYDTYESKMKAYEQGWRKKPRKCK